MGFQKSVRINPYRGANGEFASINPHASVLHGYLAGADGVFVGSFVWRYSGADVVYAEVTPKGGENPKALGWYTKTTAGEFVLVTDTTVVDGKQYYKKINNADGDRRDDTVINAGEGKPIGVVVREQVNPMIVPGPEASDLVRPGFACTIVDFGDVYVTVEAAVEIGQKVFVNAENGAKIKGGAAGATVDGYVETDWVFMDSDVAGEIVAISRH